MSCRENHPRSCRVMPPSGSWASMVGSKPAAPKPPEPVAAKPPPPAAPAGAASSAVAPAAAANGANPAGDAAPRGAAAPARPAAVPNGVGPTSTAPAAAKAAPASTAGAPPRNKAHFSYEPAPNEIMRVSITKPTTDAKLGIRLAGEEGTRPRIISLNPDGLAAKAKCLEVGDVFLKVNSPRRAPRAPRTLAPRIGRARRGAAASGPPPR